MRSLQGRHATSDKHGASDQFWPLPSSSPPPPCILSGISWRRVCLIRSSCNESRFEHVLQSECLFSSVATRVSVNTDQRAIVSIAKQPQQSFHVSRSRADAVFRSEEGATDERRLGTARFITMLTSHRRDFADGERRSRRSIRAFASAEFIKGLGSHSAPEHSFEPTAHDTSQLARSVTGAIGYINSRNLPLPPPPSLIILFKTLAVSKHHTFTPHTSKLADSSLSRSISQALTMKTVIFLLCEYLHFGHRRQHRAPSGSQRL